MESNIIGYNQQINNIDIQTQKTQTSMPKDEGTCFSDDWTGSAADVVQNAFNNMDEFLMMFKESQKPI